MSAFRYILRSLWFFRKQHLALFAGTVISTAVLTGALVVGDSVRGSLRNMVDIRLGNTRYAMQTGDRFVRKELAGDLSARTGSPVIALNLLKGIGVNPDAGTQVNNLQVVGVGSDFSGFFDVEIPILGREEVLVSANLAERLDLAVGSSMIIRVEDEDVIPLNAPFAREADPSVPIRVSVMGILDDDRMGRFSLRNSQQAEYNVFVDREFIADRLEISGLVNTLLASDTEGGAEELNRVLEEVWQPGDMSLHVNSLPLSGKMEVTSDRIFIDGALASVLGQTGPGREEVLTYLINSIELKGRSTPYSFVSAVTPPYVDEGLSGDGIVISDWLSEDLEAGIGDTLSLNYYVVGPLRKLVERSHPFVVRSVVKTGSGLVDSTLMPPYPGLSEAGNCRDWDTGIPIDLKQIRDKDEFYWDDFKGTPKALISLQTGQRLWENEFGKLTAVRFNQHNVSVSMIRDALREGIQPVDLGLVFVPAYRQGVGAAENSVDFGELFLSLSFFVIAAGLLLTVLLFSLQARYRMPESGILAALGYRRGQIVMLRFYETSLVALLGSVAGAFAGIYYNKAVLLGLNSIWQDAVNSYVLNIYVFTGTVFIGALSGFLVSVLAVFLVTRFRLKRPLKGIIQNLDQQGRHALRGSSKWPALMVVVLYAATAVLVTYSVRSGVDRNAALFLSAGALFIVGSVMLAGLLLLRVSGGSQRPGAGTARLALKNAARSRTRSLTTVALLALGTFTIIITGANRKTFYGVDLDRSSGTGGFTYWAETTMPLTGDLSDGQVRQEIGLDNEVFGSTTFFQMLTLDGDDASCLNLNQVEKPRILGVDAAAFAERNAFSFTGLLQGIDRQAPWAELQKTYGPGIIPAFADQTVITWSLKRKIGDTLNYLNENGKELKLVLAGGLNNSVFQGNILIARDHFIANFPSSAASSVMLVDAPSESSENVYESLEGVLTDYGIDLSKTSRRLAEFNSVENTYLAVFMFLGGLGVIIGTIGLGVVIARNLIERKQELALLAALGFTRGHLIRLVLTENILLLTAGMVIGILAALIGILPSLLSPSFAIPGNLMIWLLAGVLLSGILWIWIPAARMVARSLVQSLRNE